MTGTMAQATGRDRRSAVRRRTGTIAWVSHRGYGTARCTIHDVSDTGARIQAPCGLRVGDDVTLTEDGAPKRNAVAMWVEADMIGLHFSF
ncbi:MAG: PilZ domain-containing protein [Sphingomonas sp.]|uniref:PilZ domain-containing protein n=1 Tax=Sphingomonas sp. TaxID=28214 RepID=UPI001AC05C60|nr:PilZ domain-containing protein [Sphingomonas sp.]MBN8806858.1 PilZ domain-containing protein [Sphingomonas sp.]